MTTNLPPKGHLKINIITLFPKMISGFLDESILKRAQEKGACEINVINLRDYGEGTHKLVDDRPYGGGAGMLLQAEPLAKAVRNCRLFDEYGVQSKKSKTFLTSARGKKFDQEMAKSWTQLENITIICGHYEGVDQRFIDSCIDEEISIGDFVMTGGETAAVAMVDAVVRLLPGVLKKGDATTEETFMEWEVSELAKLLPENELVQKLVSQNTEKVKLLEYPHYTRPESWEDQKVPEILLGGNHAEIMKWRLVKALEMTFSKD